MTSVRSYQDIKTPEEIEEENERRYIREMERREAAEMRAEAEREERMIQEAEGD